MKKTKAVIVIGLSVVLFSTGFTSFASTGKTQINEKTSKSTSIKWSNVVKTFKHSNHNKRYFSSNTNQPTLVRWSHAMKVFQNDPHNKWYISPGKNKYNNNVISGFYNGSGGGRGF